MMPMKHSARAGETASPNLFIASDRGWLDTAEGRLSGADGDNRGRARMNEDGIVAHLVMKSS